MRKLRVTLGVMAVLLVAVALQASPPLYREGFRGDPWIQWPYPNPQSVGEDCFANCGAGCSDSPNPCGGPQQYWVQEMLADPQFAYTWYGAYTTCDYTSGTLYFYNIHVHTAPMRETYHGFKTAGCQLHDNTCGGIVWLNPGCWWSPGISCFIDREERQWSYVAGREGRWYELGDFIEGGCEQCPGGPPCLIP